MDQTIIISINMGGLEGLHGFVKKTTDVENHRPQKHRLIIYITTTKKIWHIFRGGSY